MENLDIFFHQVIAHEIFNFQLFPYTIVSTRENTLWEVNTTLEATCGYIAEYLLLFSNALPWTLFSKYKVGYSFLLALVAPTVLQIGFD